jgi:RNA polymerase-binding protein DksA
MYALIERERERPALTSEMLLAFQGELEVHRSFRLQQLHDLAEAADDAADPSQHEVTARLQRAAQASLSNIESALQRIQTGDYGRCIECGQAIQLERLAALPMVALCMSCQRARE